MKKDYFLGLTENGFHRVAYTEWGVGNDQKAPIICVHGLTRLARDFNDLAAFLSERGRHVYCPDVVGRGDSDWLKNPVHYTYDQYLADMNVLIGKTDAHQIDWIGTSMGGLLGMAFASFANSPIRRLVLNDIGPSISVKGITRLMQRVGNDPAFHSIEEAKKYYQSIYLGLEPLTDEQWQHLTENSVRQTSSGKFISKLDPNIKQSPSKSQFFRKLLSNPQKALEGILFDVNLWDMWHKITCPVLVIHGKRSDLLLADTVKKMQETHKQVEVIEVPDAGHAPSLLQPEMHEAIYQWLAK